MGCCLTGSRAGKVVMSNVTVNASVRGAEVHLDRGMAEHGKGTRISRQGGAAQVAKDIAMSGGNKAAIDTTTTDTEMIEDDGINTFMIQRCKA